MCGEGFEFNLRNIEAECYGDSTTITYSEEGLPMTVKQLQDAGVRASSTKGPAGRILCDVGQWTTTTGVARGNDHTRCCRPRQPGLENAYSAHPIFSKPISTTDPTCQGGRTGGSCEGGPRGKACGGDQRHGLSDLLERSSASRRASHEGLPNLLP